MNSLTEELMHKIKVAETEGKETVLADVHALKFHLMPPVGWLNDPNGLCQFNGDYHVFFQYSPFEVNGGLKVWGHYVSSDLIHWKYTGAPIVTDTEYETHGAYSGCAMVDEGKMHIYYTGNVKMQGEYDYITAGRGANTIYLSSEDGVHFDEKQCLLENKDYPENYTCHIRDPKVWKENDMYYMVLGGRREDDHGTVLVYESPDRMNWTYCNEITSKERFGYMWECPDLFELDGKRILSISPQGLEHEEYRYQNVYQSGYYVMQGDFTTSSYELGEFTEWDMGFDFYAPQTFEDEQGRRILIGWAGLPDIDYTNPTVEKQWQHALTVPRELKYVNGKVLQQPVKELEELRDTCTKIENGQTVTVDQGIFDLTMRAASMTNCTVTIAEGFIIDYRNGVVSITLDEKTGCGRTTRKALVSQLSNLRVLVDRSLIELYVNDGEVVFTTRYYPNTESVMVKVECEDSMNELWTMKEMEVCL